MGRKKDGKDRRGGKEGRRRGEDGKDEGANE